MTNDERQPDRTEQAIWRVERRIMDAIREKDARSLGKFLTDDFVYRTPDGGEVGRADFLAGVASLPVEILSVEGENVRVSVFDTAVVMTGVQRSRVRTGEGGRAESVSAFTDVFVKRGRRWLLALAYGVEIPAVRAAG